MKMNNRGSSLVTTGAALLVVALLAGCGSSDSGNNRKNPRLPHFSKPPITVATIAPIDTQLGSYPMIPAAVKAAALAINERGGIQGHEVQVFSCNGQADPNAEVSCARQAVAQKAVAVVGQFVVGNAGGVDDALAKAKTADLAALAILPAQFQSPIAFPINYSPGIFAGCTSPQLIDAIGAKRLGSAVVDIPIAQVQSGQVEQSARVQGANYAGPVVAPPTTIDFAPMVQQLSDKGVDFVMLALAQSAVPAFVTGAYNAGKNWAYCSYPGAIPGSLLVRLGPALQRLYEGAVLPPYTDTAKYPILKAFTAEMKAEQDDGDGAAAIDAEHYDSTSLQAWLGMQIFERVAKTIRGPITSASFLATLRKAKVNNLGVLPPIDFSKPTRAGSLTRIFNPTVLVEKWDPVKKVFTEVPGIRIDSIKALGIQ